MTPAIRAFLRAASDGDANLVRGLLAQGTDVNSVNRAGQTALMLAAGFQRSDVVRLLVAAGANIELQDDLGLNAIDWAKQDAEVIELLKQPTKTAVSKPVEEPGTNDNHKPSSAAPAKYSEPVSKRPVEESTLKGLAGAILRDHKPRLEERVQPIGTRLPPPEPESKTTPTTDDETLDKPFRELTEDTAAPGAHSRTRARIFDLNAVNERQKPISKVEVSVPQTQPRGRMVIWLLLIVVLIGVGFGIYRIGKTFLSRSLTSGATASSARPEVSPTPVTTTKSAPVVSANLVGAELYLPEAEYPSEAQGRSGRVRVEVQVSSKGIVFGAKAIDGDEVFRAAAEKAAKGSAFSPEKLADKSKVIEGMITYSFVQDQSAPSDNTTQPGVTAVAGGPLSGTELNLVEPDYSSNAKQGGASGEFTIVVRVNRAGRVMSWRPLNGDDRLRESVIQAAKRSTFSPGKLPGSGEVVGTITYKFR